MVVGDTKTMNGTQGGGEEEEGLEFETTRIEVLKEERSQIQKKTFTKWVNSNLKKKKGCPEINDLFDDLKDGKRLMDLLEIIAGKKIGKPNKGVLRVQKVENVNRCLEYLKTQVYLENIGAEDITDGNHTLTLGLIWTIILRFQIQDIQVAEDPDADGDTTGPKKQAKEALLLWCQRKTDGHEHVDVKNFHKSWRDGMAFNALLHAHVPDLVDYDALNPEDHISNLNNAFDTAERELGIPKLLDAEDVDREYPDERSVMTYVAEYYHKFAEMKKMGILGSRISNIMKKIKDFDRLQEKYESQAQALIDWAKEKTQQLDNRDLPNNLNGIQGEFQAFKNYRLQEKPPKFEDKGNIEAEFLNLQTKLKANRMKLYVPPKGLLLHDLDAAWRELEDAERNREVALVQELDRQEKLEQLAERFDKKASLRESWLDDMAKVVEDRNFGTTASAVEAAVKRQEAISADILARRDRFRDLDEMAETLHAENYHDKDRIIGRDREISNRFAKLLDSLKARQEILDDLSQRMDALREIEALTSSLKELEPQLEAKECGRHLLATEDLLQKHALLETEIKAKSERVKALNEKVKKQLPQQAVLGGAGEAPVVLLPQTLEALNQELAKVEDLARKKKLKLETAKKYHQFNANIDEEDAWVNDRIKILKNTETGSDLQSVARLLKKHEGLEDEMKARWPRCQAAFRGGDVLVKSGHENADEVKEKCEDLKDRWDRLRDLAKARRKKLEDAQESHTYYADANEAESWIREKMPLAKDDDYGKDEATARSLLNRHGQLENDIAAYDEEIVRLEDAASIIAKAQEDNKKNQGVMSTSLLARDFEEDSGSEEEVEIDVPKEIEVEEVRQKEVVQDVTEDKKVPQVMMLYKYEGQGINVAKKEKLILLNKANNDWWLVRTADGKENFVPANYTKEIEPKVVQVTKPKTVLVPETVKVKKTVMEKKKVKQKKRSRTPLGTGSPLDRVAGKKDAKGGLRRMPSMRSKENPHFDRENIKKRQQGLNAQYNTLKMEAENRRKGLEDACRLYKFNWTCDEFDEWMREKEAALNPDADMLDAEAAKAAKRRFDDVSKDIDAHGKTRLDDINAQAADCLEAGINPDLINPRKEKVNLTWKDLVGKKEDRAKLIEDSASIENFNELAGELEEFLKDRLDVLDNMEKNPAKDIATQMRQQQNMEREVDSIKDKMDILEEMAKICEEKFPNEKDKIKGKHNDVIALFNKLLDKLMKRKAKLDESHGAQRLEHDSKDLKDWAHKTAQAMKEYPPGRDVEACKANLAAHDALNDDINLNRPRFDDMDELAAKLARGGSPDGAKIKQDNQELQALLKKLDEDWQTTQEKLEDDLKLAQFMKDADQIDAASASHEAFLDFGDLGNSLDDVENLMKNHEEFLNKMRAGEVPMQNLKDKLAAHKAADHPNADSMEKRLKEVEKRRDAVKDAAEKRRKLLEDAHDFQELKRDAAELNAWVDEKAKAAEDDSFKDLGNLEDQLQKHETLLAEINANKKRLDDLENRGQELVNEDHYAAPQIADILEKTRANWRGLADKTTGKGPSSKSHLLEQAVQQKTLNVNLKELHEWLDMAEMRLKNKDTGVDLRAAKKLLGLHKSLDKEKEMVKGKIDNLVAEGQRLKAEKHFDEKGVNEAIKKVETRFKALDAPMRRRHEELDKSVKMFLFYFDIDNEKLWIAERMPKATSKSVGKDLLESQRMDKKHCVLEQEIQGHKSQVDATLANGAQLVADKHFASDDINAKCDDLKADWRALGDATVERRKLIDLNLNVHQFFHDAAEVEGWMLEKKTSLQGQTDCGKDRTATQRLLNRHEAFELDRITYGKMAEGVIDTGKNLIEKKPAESHLIAKKQGELKSASESLAKLSSTRGKMLRQYMQYHEYMAETTDFLDWIAEKHQLASSQDIGQDYEHCKALYTKFADLNALVEATGPARYDKSETLAKEIVEGNPNMKAEVDQRRVELTDKWNALLEQLTEREAALKAALEVHAFNRDVDDAVTRIQEKETSMSSDLGKDVYTVQMLQRKHEGYENELVALEAQLQIVVDDAENLKTAYPGENATQIGEQQTYVVQRWEVLQEKVTTRRSELIMAYDLQRLLAECKDLTNWMFETEKQMMVDIVAKDVDSAVQIHETHTNVWPEIEFRETTFSNLVQAGNAMIEDGHYAATDIHERLQDLLEMREKLHSSWQSRNEYLLQLVKQQIFYRDLSHLQSASTAQENYLQNQDLGNSVPAVQNLIKNHSSFEKLLGVQNEKLKTITIFGNKLVEEKNFDSANISKGIDEITARRENIQSLSNRRHDLLEASLQYNTFIRDHEEAEAWIEQKQKTLDENVLNIKDFKDKVKKLQAHQAFESEVNKNAPAIEECLTLGSSIVVKKDSHAAEVTQKCDTLKAQWTKLLKNIADRGKELAEAKDIVKYFDDVQQAMVWIKEKEILISSQELGNDYEHCLEIIKKLDGTAGKNLKLDDTSIKEIDELADKLSTLASAGPETQREIKDKRLLLDAKWADLQDGLVKYRKALDAALECHAFNRDLDDLNERINEKAKLMSSEDVGKNLTGVQTLIRKHDILVKDMSAIADRKQELEGIGKRLMQKYPVKEKDIRVKFVDTTDNWKRLCDLEATRKTKLKEARDWHQFFVQYQDLNTWTQDINRRMSSADLPRDLVSCETSLSEHNDAKTEIRGKHDKFAEAEKVGEKLIADGNYNVEEIKKCLQKLEKMEDEVSNSWEARRALLAQCMELHIFKKNCDLVEASLLAKKKQIRDELGDSVPAVDEMIGEHETFQRAVDAQKERVAAIETQADDLCSRGHYDSAGIQQRKSVVQSKWDELCDAMSLRRRTLKASLDYQQFILKANEVSKWIEVKTHTADDQNWREPTNLQKKTQAHQTFETELKANEGRVLDVMNECKEFVNQNHYRKDDIQAKASQVESQWTDLNAASAEKKKKLVEATEALLFNLSMDDIETRIQSIETQLASEDHGSDLPSAVKLLEKHNSLHQDISTLEVKIKEMTNTAQTMADHKHFLKDELSARSKGLEARYKALEGPWLIRKTNLDDTVALYKFNNEVADELDYFAEKATILENNNFGSSVSEVQGLQRKHEELTLEVRGHEPEVEAMSNEAYRMLQQNHFAASEIKVKLDGVIEAQKNVSDAVETRRIALDESLAAHEYYAKNAEAQQWLRDRQPALTSKDLGRNEDSAAKLLKKLEEVGRNVDNFGKTVAQLDKQKKTLLDQKNSYGQGIKSAQTTLDALFKECKGQAATRRDDLKNSQEWFAFQRSANEVSEWMLEKSQVALSEEYGRDLEHVDLLIQQFNDFQHNLANSESKVTVVTAKGYEICERGHPRSSEISARCWELSQQWTELRETANEREQALESARQVHKFDDDADDVIGWISSKDADLSSLEVGMDLPSVLSHIAKNEEFERELAAASERVEAVRHEASRLLAAFPDTQAHINDKVAALNKAWEKLMATAAKRKTKLTQARELMKYLINHKDLSRWCKEKSLELDVDEPVHDLAGAEALIERFADMKKEILGHKDEIKACEKRGLSLASEGGLMAEADIEERVEKLGKDYDDLVAKLEAKERQLSSKKDLQGLARELDALESWLAARQGDAESADYGDSIDRTEDMLKKHDDFGQMLTAQEEKCKNVGTDPSLLQAKQIEAKKDRDAKEKVEKQRLDELKKKEKEKLLEARDDGKEKSATKPPSETAPRPRPQSISQVREDSPAPDSKAKAAAEALKRSASSVALANKPAIPKIVKEDRYSSDEDDAAAMPPPQTIPAPNKPAPDPAIPQPLSLTMKPRKTPSFRKKGLPELPSSLPSPTLEGPLERKHTQQVGGKKAAVRSWNGYYAALCGNLLIFFKDKNSRDEMKLTSSMPPPLNVEDAAVRQTNDYKGRKNVFELKAPDGAEFLFDVSTSKERDEWLNAIGRVAGPPGLDVAFSGDRSSLNSDYDGETSPPDAPIGAPPLSPRESLGVRDVHSVSTHSNESDSGVPGHLMGDVQFRASTLPVGVNRNSSVSIDGEDEGKKKKKGFGSFLKKKKDKS